jgi:hypothetical protein
VAEKRRREGSRRQDEDGTWTVILGWIEGGKYVTHYRQSGIYQGFVATQIVRSWMDTGAVPSGATRLTK